MSATPFPEASGPTPEEVQIYLRNHPGIAADIRDALGWSLKHDGAPFRWDECYPVVSDRLLHRLLLDGLMVRVKGDRYRFVDLLATAQGLVLWQAEVKVRTAQMEEARFSRAASVTPPPGAPGDMFSEIIGYESPKRQIFLALSAPEPVHILLEGPPATAKSLFLEGLATLPGSVYRFGDAISRAGIRRLLMDEKPPYLIIDELDKISPEDDTAMLEFMERQRASMTKTGINRDEAVNIRVFAAANRTNRMRPELLSRFHRIKLKDYTQEEFRAVARAYLKKRGIPADLATLIADSVAGRTRDIRDCRRIASMARTPEDVQFLIGELGKEATV